MRQLFRELKRRNVYKVAVTYAAVAFVVAQAARLLQPALLLPDWFYRTVVVAAILGFPVALVIAWAFELTPEGVQRTSEEAGEAEATASKSPEERRAKSRLAMKALVGLGLVGAAVAGGWYLMGGGGEPSKETAASADTTHTEPRLGDRSIAVLPFANMGGAESEQFTEGVHDGLLTRLSNISDLRVISRTSVLPYRETELSLPSIADSLGVTWIVEGGVQQAGDQVQVNAQLIQAEDDAHQWAETYRRELTTENLFAVQSELTKKIARSLEAELSPQEEKRVGRRPTGDLEAYQLYVQGRGFLDQRTEPGIRTAIDYFRRALEQDSTYARAWAALAEAQVQLGGYGSAPVDSVLPLASRAVRRALELEPSLAEAHASAGLIHMYRQEGPVALRTLRGALELNPSLSQAHRWLGVLLDILGRPDGLTHLRQAVELNPMTPEAHADLAGALLIRGEFEEALHQARRGKAVEPEYRLAHFFEVMALHHLGRSEEARSVHRAEQPMRWRPSYHHAAGALLAVVAGDTAGAREVLSQLQATDAPVFPMAWIHAALGETDAAFQALQKITDWRFGVPIMMRKGFPEVLKPLRNDPRYREVIQNANRAWGLNPDGSLPDSMAVSFEDSADG